MAKTLKRVKKAEEIIMTPEELHALQMKSIGVLSSVSKNYSKVYAECGKKAEFLAVQEGLTLEEITAHPDITAAKETLDRWSIKYNWQEKRVRYLKRGDTVNGMVYEILYSHLAEAKEHQMKGEALTPTEIGNLDKLVKMYKSAGIPFPQQVATVMKVFIYFIQEKTTKNSKEQENLFEIVKKFVLAVENGIIQPDA